MPEQPPLPLLQQSTFQAYAALYSITAALPVPLAKQLTDLPQQPWRLDQTWTQSYNLNLIGRDALLVGEQIYDLAPSQRPPEQIQLHSWAWSYNLSLVGKDRLPAGEQITELTLGQRPPEQIQLHSWSWSYNLNLRGRDVLPTGEQISDLPPRDPRDVRSWSWSYNLNLIGLDRLPVGEQTFDLAPRTAPPIFQSWEWRYNLNLIGKDQLPAGEQVYVLAPAQVPPEQTQLHSWQWWYNLNLIAQDKLPVGEQVWERPILPIPPALTWTDPLKLALTPPILNITIDQYYDRPQLPVPPTQSWTASYNQNLIGKDSFPAGEQTTELVPRDFARIFQTWIQSVNAALVVTPPVLDITKPQRDWPVPKGPEPDWRRSWEWQYNKNLIGQDQLPVRQRDWPLAPAPIQAAQTWINQTSLLLTAAPTFPLTTFSQYDWPVPRDYQRQVQTWTNTIALALVAKPFAQTDWPNPTQFARDPTLATTTASYNQNLIGQDKLPNRQQDWQLTPTARPGRDPTLDTIAASFNKNLIGKDLLPFSQSDWPLSSAHALNQIPLQIFVQGKWFNLVPIAHLPPGVQNSGELYDRPMLAIPGSADLYTIGQWSGLPIISPPPVVTRIPLRTLMGTGV